MSNADLQFLLRDVLEAGLSTNSGIYAGIDPRLQMRMNDRGEYEYVDLDLNYDGSAHALLQVSAFSGLAPDESLIAHDLYGSQPSVVRDELAGYHVGSFAGWAKEGEIRATGSSGGLATWMLLELMRRGEIDGVIHFTKSESGARLFNYEISRTAEEVLAGAKTRYYPGELSNVLREVRQKPGRYALVGIPSFVYELRLLQRLDPIYRERIPFVFGLICGHQKTANYASYLAWRAGIEPGDLRAIDFRKKVAGEPSNRYSTELLSGVSGSERSTVVPQEQLLGTDWGMGFFKSNFSDHTQDALNETADIAFGDAWLPRYTADGLGTNVVLVRDGRLLRILEEGRAREMIHLENIPLSDIVASQTSLVRQSILEAPYRFKRLAKGGERTLPVRRTAYGEKITFARRLTQRLRLETSRRSHSAYLEAIHEGSLSAFDRSMLSVTNRYAALQKALKLQRLLRQGPRVILPKLMNKIHERRLKL